MAGRPRAKIDWDKVDRLLEAGCQIKEIAGHFGIHVDTFYDRCLTDKNIHFSEYSRSKKARGESLLRAAQYNQAMSGNTTMQIWLGKQRLGQRERPKDETDVTDKIAESITKLVELNQESKKEEDEDELI